MLIDHGCPCKRKQRAGDTTRRRIRRTTQARNSRPTRAPSDDVDAAHRGGSLSSCTRDARSGRLARSSLSDPGGDHQRASREDSSTGRRCVGRLRSPPEKRAGDTTRLNAKRPAGSGRGASRAATRVDCPQPCRRHPVRRGFRPAYASHGLPRTQLCPPSRRVSILLYWSLMPPRIRTPFGPSSLTRRRAGSRPAMRG